MMQNLRNSIEAVKLTHDIASLREIKTLLEKETESLDNRLVSADADTAAVGSGDLIIDLQYA